MATAAAATDVDPVVPETPGVIFAVNGKCSGVMEDIKLRNRRMRHVPHLAVGPYFAIFFAKFRPFFEKKTISRNLAKFSPLFLGLTKF